MGQRFDVCGPFAQGRKVDAQHVDAVVEIFPEPTLTNQRLDVRLVAAMTRTSA